MRLKKNSIYKLLFLSIIGSLNATGYWVKYGWEIFDHVTDARTASLGNTIIAYPISSMGGFIANPAFQFDNHSIVELTHQSRFAGMVNSDYVGFRKEIRKNVPVHFSILYEGIGKIPDTRSMLLDWGADGVFGTQDSGEGNGIIDEGERLNVDSIKYFSQHILGLHGAFNKTCRQWQVGIGTKLLFHFIDDHHAIGIGLDLGFFRRFNGFNFGFVLRNIPSSGILWENGTIEGTLPNIDLGFNVPINMINYGLEFNPILSIRVNPYNRSLDSDIGFGTISIDTVIGMECKYDNNLAVRIGRNPLGTMVGGIGISWKRISMDYGFLSEDSNSGLGNHHLITLGFSPDWLVEKVSR